MAWKCPKCKSTDLRVEVTTIARLYQTDENFETEVEGDHEWDETAVMLCDNDACNFTGEAHEFEVDADGNHIEEDD